MRTTIYITVILAILLAGCSKNNTPINFNCKIADTYINANVPTLLSGNASTSYNPTNGAFGLTMIGANNQSVAVTWYNVDSIPGIKNLTPKTYTILPFQYNTPTIAAAYQSQAGNTYATGGASSLTGTVTITTNTGPGGVMSGTFSFNGLNTNGGDTVYVTQGSFTSIGIPAQ